MSKINYINTIRLTFLLTIILSSCTIQKKRYSSGYYLNLSINKPHSGLLQRDGNSTLPNIVSTEKEMMIDDSQAERIQTDSARIEQVEIYSSTSKNVIKPMESRTENNQLITKNDIMQVKTSHNNLKDKIKMTKKKSSNNPKRNLAIIIGIALLLMAVIAAFSAPAISGMFVLGNPFLTARNVTSGFSKYTGAVIGWFGIFLLDLLISVGIYNYYNKENKKKALISSGLRVVYSIFLGGAIIQLLKVTPATPALALYNYINCFNSIWGWGLIAFGIHLITLGILFKNEGGKKWLNTIIKALLIIAGAGYIILNVGVLFAPNPLAFVALIQPIFLIPMILGEVLFAIWMLIKGGKVAEK